jgi:hypothetical protein
LKATLALARVFMLFPLSVGSLTAATDLATAMAISQAQDDQILLSWHGAMLRPYQVEVSQDLMTWTDCGCTQVGNDAAIQTIVPKPGTRGFYRLREGAVRPGFDQTAMSRGDDHCYPQFTGPVTTVDLGFTINMFGVSRTACYVNNNGNITFDGPLFVYTPESLIRNKSIMIAPFWADVDSRNPLSGVTRFSNQPGMVNGRPAFGVTWREVGYFSQHVEKVNTFQLILIERADRNPGDFDIEFNYNRIEWETGDASGGSAGYGGAAARVGWTNGQGLFMEYQGSGNTLALLDRLPGNDPNFLQGLIYQTWNSGVPGRILIPVVNGLPQTEAALNYTVNAGPDTSLPASSGRVFSLNGTVSPPETTGVTYSWVQEGGPSEALITGATTLSPTMQIADPGQYTFRLYGVKKGTFTASSSDTVSITHPGVFEIIGGDYRRFAADPLAVQLTEATAKFNGQNLTAIQWIQTEGEKASIQGSTTTNPTVLLPASGFYRFKMTASTNHNPPFVKTADATVLHSD